MAFIRKVKTASGAAAVQIVYKEFGPESRALSLTHRYYFNISL